MKNSKKEELIKILHTVYLVDLKGATNFVKNYKFPKKFEQYNDKKISNLAQKMAGEFIKYQSKNQKNSNFNKFRLSQIFRKEKRILLVSIIFIVITLIMAIILSVNNISRVNAEKEEVRKISSCFENKFANQDKVLEKLEKDSKLFKDVKKNIKKIWIKSLDFELEKNFGDDKQIPINSCSRDLKIGVSKIFKYIDKYASDENSNLTKAIKSSQKYKIDDRIKSLKKIMQ